MFRSLGIAYAGSAREDVQELLTGIVSDTTLNMELSSMAALSLGLIFVGTGNGDITSTILQTMMERDETAMKDTFAKFMALGLALLFLGKQDAADATLETLKAIESPLAKQATVLVEGCAYSATGNVLKVQEMLHYCNDHLDKEKEDDTFQGFAALAIALVAMGEDIGSQMALRTMNHLVRSFHDSMSLTMNVDALLRASSAPCCSLGYWFVVCIQSFGDCLGHSEQIFP